MLKRTGFAMLVVCVVSAAAVAQARLQVAAFTKVGDNSVTLATVTTTDKASDAVEGIKRQLGAALGLSGAPDRYVVVTLETETPVVIDLREFPLVALNRILKAKGYAGSATFAAYVSIPDYTSSGGQQVFNSRLRILVGHPAGSASPFYFDGQSVAVSWKDLQARSTRNDVVPLDVLPQKEGDAEGFAVVRWYNGDPCGGW